jgi:hypothetical protein
MKCEWSNYEMTINLPWILVKVRRFPDLTHWENAVKPQGKHRIAIEMLLGKQTSRVKILRNFDFFFTSRRFLRQRLTLMHSSTTWWGKSGWTRWTRPLNGFHIYLVYIKCTIPVHTRDDEHFTFSSNFSFQLHFMNICFQIEHSSLSQRVHLDV